MLTLRKHFLDFPRLDRKRSRMHAWASTTACGFSISAHVKIFRAPIATIEKFFLNLQHSA